MALFLWNLVCSSDVGVHTSSTISMVLNKGTLNFQLVTVDFVHDYITFSKEKFPLNIIFDIIGFSSTNIY